MSEHIEVSYMMAQMTLGILQELERKGMNFTGLAQDWEELIKEYENKQLFAKGRVSE